MNLRPHQLGADRAVLEFGVSQSDIKRFVSLVNSSFNIHLDEDWISSKGPTYAALAQEISQRLEVIKETPPEPQAKEPLPAPAPLSPLELLGQQMETMYSLFKAQWVQLGGDTNKLPLTPNVKPEATVKKSLSQDFTPFTLPLKHSLPLKLTPLQENFVSELVKRLKNRTRASRAAFENSPLAKVPEPLKAAEILAELNAPVVKHSAGVHFLDLDGNDFLDFSLEMGYLGHHPSFVTEAISERLERGFGEGPFSDAAALASEKTRFLAGDGRLAFFGTEDVAMRVAIMLSRLASGRKTVAVFSSHSPGIYDHLGLCADEHRLAKFGLEASGNSGFVLLEYGRESSLAQLMDLSPHLAAVIAEPVHSRDLRFQSPRYLGRIRRITQDKKVAMILDETVLGPAFLPGGVGGYLGVQPDLAVYGSTLSSGIPLGIVCGLPQYLEVLESSAGVDAHCLSTPAHPLALAALSASLGHLALRGEQIFQRTTKLNQSIFLKLNLWFQEKEVPLAFKTFGPYFVLEPILNDDSLRPLELELFYLLLVEGNIFPGSLSHRVPGALRVMNIAEPHGREDGQFFYNTVIKSILSLREGGFPFSLSKKGSPLLKSVTGPNLQVISSYAKEGGQDGAHEVLAFKLDRKPNILNLKDALSELTARCEALNNSFYFSQGGLAHSYLEDEAPFRLEFVRDFASETHEDAVKDFLKNYDLSKAPLCHAGLIERGDHFIFVLDSLEGIIDRESLKILVEDLNVLMLRKPQLPIRAQESDAKRDSELYLDQKDPDGKTQRQLSLEYWLGELKSGSYGHFPLDNPLLKNSPLRRSLYQRIGGAPLEKCRGKIKELGISPELFYLGALGLTLKHFSPDFQSFVVGRNVDGRPSQKSLEAVGNFSRIVPMVLKDPSPTAAYLQELANSYERASKFSAQSAKEIANAFGKNFIETQLSYEKIDPELLSWPNVKASYLPVPPPITSAYLDLRLSEETNFIHFYATSSEAISLKSAKNFSEHFAAAMEELAKVTATITMRALYPKKEPGAQIARPEPVIEPSPLAPKEAKTSAPLGIEALALSQELLEETGKRIEPSIDPFAKSGQIDEEDVSEIKKIFGTQGIVEVLPLAPGQKGYLGPRRFAINPVSFVESRRAVLEEVPDINDLTTKLSKFLQKEDCARLRLFKGKGSYNVLVSDVPLVRDIFSVEDISSLSLLEKEKHISKVITQFAEDLELPPNLIKNVPPLKLRLFKLEENLSELLLSTNVVAIDAKSAKLLLEFLLDNSDKDYEGPGLAQVIEKILNCPDKENQTKYWEKVLKEPCAANRIPRRGTLKEAPRVLTVSMRLRPDFTAVLRKAASREKVSMEVYVTGIFAVLLSRVSLSEKVSLGRKYSGLNSIGLPSAFGPFSVDLPIVLNVPWEGTFSELLASINRLEGQAKEKDLLGRMELAVLSSLGPDVITHTLSYLKPSNNSRIKRIKELGSPGPHSLVLDVRDGADICEFNFVYQRSLFEPWQVEVLCQSYYNLLKDAAENPGATLGSLRLSEPDQDLSLVRQNNARPVKYESQSVVDLFRRAMSSNKNGVAVILDDFSQSYEDLENESEKFAAQLKAAGFGPGSRVALIFGDTPPEYPGILLGIFKSGAMAVPLSSNIDTLTLEKLLIDSKPGLIICEERMPENLLGAVNLIGDTPIVDPKGNFLKGGDQGVMGFSKISGHFIKRERDRVLLSPDSPAYIVYVSGILLGKTNPSQGPRGVMVSHRALSNQLSWAGDLLDIAPGDVQSSYAPTSSDVSLMEILVPLTRGATLLLLSSSHHKDDESLWETIHSHKVSSLSLPLRKLRQYVTRHSLYGLKTILTWGRGLSGDNIQELIRGNNSCRIINCYGQPECTVTALAEAAHPGILPETMGRPVPNCPSYILDKEKRLLPAGFPGELHVGGTQVAMGYDHMEDETARAFIPDPFASLSPPEYRASKLFKTGILASRRPDGRIDYMGRAGDVIEMRGIVIPVSEVERTLLGARGVLEALVVKREDYISYFEPYLAAYLTVSSRISKAEIKSYLEAHLPAYAVPEKIVILNEFPLDSFGRVDIRALPAPGMEPDGIEPQEPQESTLVPTIGESPQIKGSDPFAGAPADLKPQEKEKLLALYGENLVGVMPLAPFQVAVLAKPLAKSQMTQVRLKVQEGLVSTLRISLQGPLDQKLLEERLAQSLKSRDIFRMGFFLRDPYEPAVLFFSQQPAMEKVYTCEDLRAFDNRKKEDRAEAVQARHIAQLSDLSTPPLIRVTLFRLEDELWELIISLNQLISDTYAGAIFFNDLFSQVDSSTAKPAYFSFLERRPEGKEESREYWKQKLGALTRVTTLPMAGEMAQTGELVKKVDTLTLQLPDELNKRLGVLAKDLGVNVQSILMTAWALVLARAARTKDLNFAFIANGRLERGQENLLGPTASLLPLVCEVQSESLISSLILKVHKDVVEALGYGNITVTELEDISPFGVETINHVLTFRRALSPEAGDLKVLRIKEKARRLPYPLVILFEEGKHLSAEFMYEGQLFRPWQINILSETYLTVLNDALIEGARVRDVKLLSDEGLRLQMENDEGLVRTWDGSTVPELFKKWAALGASLPAVTMGNINIPYGELDFHSETLSKSLMAQGASGERVGILMERSPAYPGALMGVLKSGAAVVPLPKGDAEELSLILSDSQPKVVVCGKEIDRQLLELLDRVPPLTVVDYNGNILKNSSAPISYPVGTKTKLDAGTPAYVVYSDNPSGELGKVGVVVSHGALFNNIAWFGEFLELRSGDTQSSFSPFTQDFSLMEILTPLTRGARVFIFSDEDRKDLSILARSAKEGFVTSMFLPKRIMKLFAENYSIRFLKTLSTVGEGFSEPFKIKDSGDCKLVVGYGIPECGVTISAESAAPGMTPLALGFSGANCPAFVLDEYGELLPPGFPGDLFIGGAQVALGYLGRPELTERYFPPDPFKNLTPAAFRSERLFNPRILVWRDPAGRLHFVGPSSQPPKAPAPRLVGFVHKLEKTQAELTVPEEETSDRAGTITDLKLGPSEAPASEGSQKVQPLLESTSLPTPGETPGKEIEEQTAQIQGETQGQIQGQTQGQIQGEAIVEPLEEEIALDELFPTFDADGLGNLEPKLTQFGGMPPAQEEGGGKAPGDLAQLDELIPIDDEALERVELEDDAEPFIFQGGRGVSISSGTIPRVRLEQVPEPQIEDMLAPKGTPYELWAKAPSSLTEEDKNYILGLFPKGLNKVLSLTPFQLGMLANESEPVHSVRLSLPEDSLVTATSVSERLTSWLDNYTFFREGLVTTGISTPVRIFVSTGKSADSVLRVEDLSSLDLRARGKRIADRAKSQVEELKNTLRPPLLAVDLFTFSAGSELLVSANQAVLDKRSFLSFVQGLIALDPKELPEAEREASFFEPLGMEQRAKNDSIWEKLLAVQKVATFIPPRNIRPKAKEVGTTKVVPVRFKAKDLEAFTSAASGDMESFLYGAWAAFLTRFLESRSIMSAILLPAAKDESLGQGEAMVPICLPLNKALSLENAQAQVRETILQISELKYLSYPEILRLSPLGMDSTSHLYVPPSRNTLATLPTITDLEDPISSFEFPLALVWAPFEGGLELKLHYQVDYLEPWQVEVLAQGYEIFLRAQVENPSQKIGEVVILPEEKERVLINNNAARLKVPETSLVELIDERCLENPGDIAVTCGDRTLTYGHLREKSIKVAKTLSRKLLPGDLAAIIPQRSELYVSALLGLLRSGAVAAPLSLALGEELPVVLGSLEPKCLVCPNGELPEVKDLISRYPFLTVIDYLGNPITGLSSGESTVDLAPVSPASYAFAVQGLIHGFIQGNDLDQKRVSSLGSILVSHEALVNLATMWTDFLKIVPLDSFGVTAEPSLITFVAQALVPLTRGAKVCILEEDKSFEINALSVKVQEYALTHLYLPQDLTLSYVINARLKGLKYLISMGGRGLGGGAIAPEFAYHALSDCGNAKVLFVYGVNEALGVNLLEAAHPERLPETIGSPAANCPAWVLDSEARVLPAGYPGELGVGGAMVSHGYLNDPLLSDKNFIPDPLKDKSPAEWKALSLFRTGDRVRRRPDGRMEYLGDIKLSLDRDPALIEKTLLSYPGVYLARVFYQQKEDKILTIACVGITPTPEPSKIPAIERQLLFNLTQDLRPTLVPDKVSVIGAAPLDPYGRLDKSKLSFSPEGYEAQEKELSIEEGTGEKLLKAVEAALKLAPASVSLQDNFRAKGGDLLSSSLVSLALTASGIKLAPKIILGAPSLAASLKHAFFEIQDKDLEEGPKDPFAEGTQIHTLASLRKQDEKTVRELLAPISPVAISVLTPHMEVLARALEEGGPSYTSRLLEVPMAIDPFTLEGRLAVLAQRHEILRSLFISKKLSRPRLAIMPERTIPLTFTSLIGFGEKDQRERIEEFRGSLESDELLKESLFRVDIFQVKPEVSLILVSYLDLAIDLISLSTITEELFQGRAPGGNPRPFSLFLSQLEGRTSDGGAFWAAALKGVKKEAGLFAPAYGTVDGPAGDLPLSFTIEDSVYKRLKVLAREGRLPVPALLESAFGITLSLYNGEKVQVYTQIAPVRGALSGELKSTVGQLLTRAPTKTEVTYKKTFLEIAGTQERFNAEAAAFAYTPLSEVRRVTGLNFGDIVFHAEEEGIFGPRGLKIKERETKRRLRLDGEFIFHFEWNESFIRGYAHASSLRFKLNLVESFIETYQSVLQSLVSNPKLPLSALELPLAPMRRKLISDGAAAALQVNWGDFSFPEGLIIGDGALHDSKESRNFPKLSAIRDKLIGLLQGQKEKPKVLAVLGQGTFLGISAVAAFTAGWTLVPLSPLLPKERIKFALKDSETNLFLVQSEYLSLANTLTRELAKEGAEISICDFDEFKDKGHSFSPLEVVNYDENKIAALFYGLGPSSGTAWTREAIEKMPFTLSYKGAGERVLAARELIQSGQKVLFCSGGPSEGLGQFFHTVLAPWSLGNEVFEVPSFKDVSDRGTINKWAKAIANCILTNGITLAFVPEFIVPILLEEKEATASLRTLIITGASGAVLGKQEGELQIIYLYDNTGVMGLYSSLDLSFGGAVLKGKPAKGLTAYIMGDEGKVLPHGAIGEIYFGGSYIGEPKGKEPHLDFLLNPYAGSFLLKTGTLGFNNGAGEIVVLFPLEEKHYLRGRPYVPFLVESRILSLAQVKNCQVYSPDGTELSLNLILEEKIGDGPYLARKLSELRGSFLQLLPPWLIPSKINVFDSLGAQDPFLVPADDEVEATGEFTSILNEIVFCTKDHLDGAKGPNVTFMEGGLDDEKAYSLSKNLEARGFMAGYKDFYAFATPRILAYELIEKESLMPVSAPMPEALVDLDTSAILPEATEITDLQLDGDYGLTGDDLEVPVDISGITEVEDTMAQGPLELPEELLDLPQGEGRSYEPVPAVSREELARANEVALSLGMLGKADLDLSQAVTLDINRVVPAEENFETAVPEINLGEDLPLVDVTLAQGDTYLPEEEIVVESFPAMETLADDAPDPGLNILIPANELIRGSFFENLSYGYLPINTASRTVILKEEISDEKLISAYNKILREFPLLRLFIVDNEDNFLKVSPLNEKSFVNYDLKDSGKDALKLWAKKELELKKEITKHLTTGPTSILYKASFPDGTIRLSFIFSTVLLDPVYGIEALSLVLAELGKANKENLKPSFTMDQPVPTIGPEDSPPLKYWAKKLSDMKPAAFLRSSKNENEELVQSPIDFPPELVAKSKKTIERLGVMPAAFAAALWGSFLALYLDEDSVLVPLTLRRDGRAITLPLLIKINELSFLESIEKAQADILEGIKEGLYSGSFVGLLAVLKRMGKRELTSAYICNALYVDLKGELPPLEGEYQGDFLSIYPKAPLSLLLDTKIDYAATLTTNSSFFGSIEKDFIVSALKKLMKELIENPQKPISRVSLVDTSAKEKILELSQSANSAPEPKDSLGFVLEKKGRENSKAKAIVFPGGLWTYGELLARAKELASFSGDMGPGLLGAVLEPWGPDYVSNAFSLILNGAALLPLDAEYGRMRIKSILSDSAPDLLICNSGFGHLVDDYHGAKLMTHFASSPSPLPGHRPQREEIARDVALIMYKGSNEVPLEGAMFTGISLLSLARQLREYYKMGPDVKCAILEGTASSEAVVGMISVLLSGGELHTPPEECRYNMAEFAKWVDLSGVNMAFVPTLLAKSLAFEPPRSLRVVLASGAPHDFVRPQPYGLNGVWGPQEALGLAYARPYSEGSVPASLGKPWGGTHGYVLAKNGSLRPLSLSGELCISGPLVSTSYFKGVGSSFSPNPYGAAFGPPYEKMLHTRRMVRLLPSGETELIGASCQRINILGSEPLVSEIEEAILAYPGVFDAKVLPFTGSNGASHLEAFIIRKGTRANVPLSLKREEEFSLFGSGGLSIDPEPLPETHNPTLRPKGQGGPQDAEDFDLLDMPDLADDLDSDTAEVDSYVFAQESSGLDPKDFDPISLYPPKAKRDPSALNNPEKAPLQKTVDDSGQFLRGLYVYLKNRLPIGFVPKYLGTLPSWPLTPWGSLDTSALTRPWAVGMLSNRGKNPRTLGEFIISLHLPQLLSEELNLYEDFVSLGGDALLALKFAAILKDTIGFSPSPLEILMAPTLKELALDIEDAIAKSKKPILRLKKGQGTGVVIVPLVSGSILSFRFLARALKEKASLYCLNPLAERAQVSSIAPKDLLASQVEEAARELSKIYPQGDFCILGASYKAMQAWELGKELAEDYHVQPKCLILLDAIEPAPETRSLAQAPGQADVEKVFKSISSYEGIEPLRRDARTDTIFRELSAWGAYHIQKAPLKVINITSEIGTIDSLPFGVERVPIKKYALGGVEEISLASDHFSLFKSSSLDSILTPINSLF
ncbi:MAG: aminotransferase class III-fold pyridoxal phosphate-dependent enzyme [Deltaproteobacteria bacterium]|nr:aminotransferase class III-fold pyridoxal phosphate-dependent enzyme [Deltaproteobacteria bacterium]